MIASVRSGTLGIVHRDDFSLRVFRTAFQVVFPLLGFLIDALPSLTSTLLTCTDPKATSLWNYSTVIVSAWRLFESSS